MIKLNCKFPSTDLWESMTIRPFLAAVWSESLRLIEAHKKFTIIYCRSKLGLLQINYFSLTPHIKDCPLFGIGFAKVVQLSPLAGSRGAEIQGGRR